jgi:hypothetical protein
MLGLFQSDLALKHAHPLSLAHSTDVSLLSCALGTLAAGGKFLIAFEGRLAVIEDLITDQPSTARRAARACAGDGEVQRPQALCPGALYQ